MVIVNLFLMGLVLFGLSSLTSFTFLYVCTHILLKYPTSKVASWVRNNVITDKDLEP